MVIRFKQHLAAAALLAGGLVFAPLHALAADEHGSEAEAMSMVKKAVALVKSAGPEKAYKEFNEHPDNTFKDRDLYVFAYDFEGKCLAQGANSKMVGLNVLDMKDANGKPLAREQIELAKTKKTFWYGPYKFSNPLTKKVDTKKAYCEETGNQAYLCVGVYLGS
jgi:cytochrome c